MSEPEKNHIPVDRRERRLRIAAILIIVGLAIEVVSLRYAHPTAFLVFVGGSGLLIGCGVLLFLMVLFATGPESSRPS
jgi:hypothetical protein